MDRDWKKVQAYAVLHSETDKMNDKRRRRNEPVCVDFVGGACFHWTNQGTATKTATKTSVDFFFGLVLVAVASLVVMRDSWLYAVRGFFIDTHLFK